MAVWQLYQEDLRRHCLVDFGDMLAAVVALLEREESEQRGSGGGGALAALRRRHTHVAVDEFQDCNLLQVGSRAAV